ncbi:MAG: hypothetical protein WAX04_12955 [Oscillospiraceae bacterium]
MSNTDDVDKSNSINSIDDILNQVECLHNGPEGGEEVEIGLNRVAYIKGLMQENFIPTEELVGLYAIYMSGSVDAWWCKSSLTFREFLDVIKKMDLRDSRTKKDYRRGFADGIRFILDAMAA